MYPALPLIIPVVLILTMLLYARIVLLLMKRSRKGRAPWGNDVQLMRQPAESLRERLNKLNEQIGEELMEGMLAPTLVALLLGVILWSTLTGSARTLAPFFVLSGYAVSLAYRIRRILAKLTERRCLRLGITGERVVADTLQPLSAEGFHIVNDMPAQGALSAFNLDHVVVGPPGLFVVETKARRKPNAEADGADHVVRFDGRALHWPDYSDVGAVQQATNNADWLRTWVQQRLGFRVEVKSILALPGWWVERTGNGQVLAVSHKELPKTIRGKTVLDAQTVDQIRRQLESVCRNVACEA